MERKDYNVKITYFNLGANIIEFPCTQIEYSEKVPSKIQLVVNNLTAPSNLKGKLKAMIEANTNFTLRIYDPNLSGSTTKDAIFTGTDKKNIYLQLDSRGNIVSINLELGVLTKQRPSKAEHKSIKQHKRARAYKKKSKWWDRNQIPIIPEVGVNAIQMTESSNKLSEGANTNNIDVDITIKDAKPEVLEALVEASIGAAEATKSFMNLERKGSALDLWKRLGEQLHETIGNEEFLYALQHILVPKGVARKYPYIVWADLEKLLDEVENEQLNKTKKP